MSDLTQVDVYDIPTEMTRFLKVSMDVSWADCSGACNTMTTAPTIH